MLAAMNWNNLNRFRQVWTSSDVLIYHSPVWIRWGERKASLRQHIEPIIINSDMFAQGWASSDKFKQVHTRSIKFCC